MKPLSLTMRAFLVFAAMAGFLTLMAGTHFYKRASGVEIILDMRPVDPRSLFRGYYVVVDTNISELDTGRLKGDDDFKAGDTIYVMVEEGDDGVWRAVSADHRLAASGVAVKGVVTFAREPYAFEEDRSDVGQIIDVAYNLESYFAEEKVAKKLEVEVRDGDLQLIVSVTRSGDAVIKGLVLNGERLVDTLF